MKFSAVENVLKRGPLSLVGSKLTIAPYAEEPMVKISGVSQNISEEMLELYFENTRKTGGGEIKSIDMLPSMQAAIITFADTAGKYRTGLWDTLRSPDTLPTWINPWEH